MRYVENTEMHKAKVKLYTFCIEPCELTGSDGETVHAWDGYAKVVLESGEETIWYYGENRNPGELLENMRNHFDTLEVQII